MSSDNQENEAGNDQAAPSIEPNGEKDSTVNVLVYRQLQRVAKKVAEPLKNLPEVKKIILSTDPQISEKLQNYATMLRYLKSLNESCRDATSSLDSGSAAMEPESVEKSKSGEADAKPFTKVQATLTAAETVLKAVSELFALFTVEENYTQTDVDLDNDAVVAAVGGAFVTGKESTVELYHESRLTSSNGEFSNQVNRLKAHVSQLNLLKAKLDNNEADKNSNELQALINVIEALQISLMDEKGSTLVAFLKNEKIMEMLTNRDVALLTINIPFCGGERVVVKNSFFHRNQIDVAGGVVISYMLSIKNGRILSSGLVESFSGYQAYRDIKMSDLKTVSPPANE